MADSDASGNLDRKAIPSINSRDHAAALVRCLTSYVAKQDDSANRVNLRVATEWMRLIDTKEPAPADIDALAASLETLENAGSVTNDLQISVSGWVREWKRLRRRL